MEAEADFSSSSLPESLRLFVAVPVPPEVERRALSVIAQLRGKGDVKWVPGDRLHVTLKFIGAAAPDRLGSIRRVLGKSANNFSPFVLELGSAGAFPHVRHPRTVWLGLRGDTEALQLLAREVDRALHSLGFPLETRPFQAHLTIGRVKSPKGIKELGESLHRLAGIRQLPEELPAWTMDEYYLVHSDLHPSGPRYTVLSRFPLRREQSPDQDSTSGTG